MKIAFVTSDLTFPPREGLHEQTLLLLSSLRRRAAHVELFGYCKHPERLDRAALESELGIAFTTEPIVDSRSSLLVGFLNRGPVRLRARERQLLAALKTGGFDVVHLEGVAAAGLFRRSLASRTILSLVDPGSRRQWRLASTASDRRNRLTHRVASAAAFAFEVSLRDSRVAWHVVSPSDALYLERFHRQPRVVAIPVQLPRDTCRDFAPTDARPAVSGVGALVFADLGVPHMRDAVEEFLNDVIRPAVDGIPAACFTVLGRVAPDQRMRRAAQGLPIRFVAWEPDHRSLLRDATFIILPDTAGTGLKNRAVQSMSLGKAVLGTSVAFEGLSVRHGHEAFVYDHALLAQEGLRTLFGRGNVRDSLGDRAAALVRLHYAESVVMAAWLELYAARAADGEVFAAQPLSATPSLPKQDGEDSG